MPADVRDCTPILSYPDLRIPISESRIPNSEPRLSEGEPTQAQVKGTLESFQLTPELEAWSMNEGIKNPTELIEEFKDYWRSTGGKRKNGQPVKDWAAVFRNRVRFLKSHGLLNQTHNTLPPQQKCAWTNGEGCETYAMAGSKYCQAHKEMLVKIQQRRE